MCQELSISNRKGRTGNTWPTSTSTTYPTGTIGSLLSEGGSTKSKVVDEPPNLDVKVSIQEERNEDAYQICHKLKRSNAISTAIIVRIPWRKYLTHLLDLFISRLLPLGDVVEVPDDGPRGIDRRAESGASEDEGEGEDEGCGVHSLPTSQGSLSNLVRRVALG